MSSEGGCTYVHQRPWTLLLEASSTEACCVSPVVAGELQAYDQHLNMILGDVEETVTTVEIDEETYEELYKVQHRLWTWLRILLLVGDFLFSPVCVLVNKEEHPDAVCARRRRGPRSSAPPCGLIIWADFQYRF